MFSILKSRRGFTLIELMIVIIVIAILALIVIPKLANASRKAKEAAMRANVLAIRNAVSEFELNYSCNPTKLEDLTKVKADATVSGVDSDGVTVDVDATGKYAGPTLREQGGLAGGIPKNPFITSATAEVAGLAGPTAATTPSTAAHWVYDKATGKVWPNSFGTTIDDGTSYGAL